MSFFSNHRNLSNDHVLMWQRVALATCSWPSLWHSASPPQPWIWWWVCCVAIAGLQESDHHCSSRHFSVFSGIWILRGKMVSKRKSTKAGKTLQWWQSEEKKYKRPHRLAPKCWWFFATCPNVLHFQGGLQIFWIDRRAHPVTPDAVLSIAVISSFFRGSFTTLIPTQLNLHFEQWVDLQHQTLPNDNT